jgi:hypothetical protein
MVQPAYLAGPVFYNGGAKADLSVTGNNDLVIVPQSQDGGGSNWLFH